VHYDNQLRLIFRKFHQTFLLFHVEKRTQKNDDIRSASYQHKSFFSSIFRCNQYQFIDNLRPMTIEHYPLLLHFDLPIRQKLQVVTSATYQ